MSAKKTISSQPNILWFCADQMRHDTISGLGNDDIRTPNLDAFMSRSVTFENYYVQNQVCTPSRVSMMTGRYPAAHQVYRNGNKEFPVTEKLVTRLLADEGYDCGLIGKLHLSTATVQEKRPDDGYRTYLWCQNPGWEKIPKSNAYWNWLRDKKNVDPADYFGKDNRYIRTGPPADLHQAAWCAEASIEFIAQKRDGPWMLSVNPFDPHPPFDPPIEYAYKYNPEDLKPPLFQESDIVRQKQFSKIRNQMVEAVNPVLNAEDKENLPIEETNASGSKPPKRFDGMAVKAAYYAMIENLDHQFGRIITHLEDINEIDNTIIIFTSDHGEMLGDHGLLYKGCKFFEGLIHVPLIIALPRGAHKNEKTRALVESVDLAPTLLDACNIDIPYYMQGRSLVGLLTGKADFAHHKDVVVTDFNDSLGASEIENYTQASMTFDGRYKLAVYHSQPGLGELYDLQNDPGEFINLWSDPACKDLKGGLIERHLNVMMGTVSAGIERVANA